jgi:4-hydroxy-2-oxoheptanedioate aldolase
VALIGAIKYRPLKGKKLQRILHGDEKLSAEMQAYVLSHNRHNSLLINIESPEGVKNLDAFLSIPSLDGPGVDGIVLGPHDLSTSFNMPEKYASEEFLQLSRGIIQRIRAQGVAAGGHTGFRNSVDLSIDWAQHGANIILHCSDMFFSADKAQHDFNRIKNSIGETPQNLTNQESI